MSRRTRSLPTTRSLLRRPADPAMPPRLSSEDAREAVYKAVNELHARGAVDTGNGDALDPWLDRVRSQWLGQHVLATTQHATEAELEAARHEADAVVARQRAAIRHADVARTRQDLAEQEKHIRADVATAASKGREMRRRPRPELDPLEGLTRSWTWEFVSKVALLVAAAGDFISFWITLQGMLVGTYAWMAFILAFALTAAAVTLMHTVGRTARNLREGYGGLGRLLMVLTTAAWLALGVATFYVRWQVTQPSGGSGGLAFGGSAPSVDEPLLSALLLAALFVGSGLLAFWMGFSEHHPRMAQYLRLRRRLSRQQEKAAAAERRAIAAERLRDTAEAEIGRTAERSTAARAVIEAEIAELKELARIHLAGLVGDPASTNYLIRAQDDAAAEAGGPAGGPVIPAPAAPVDDPAGGNGNGRARVNGRARTH